jgi:tyrosyl-tRNA synthetase
MIYDTTEGLDKVLSNEKVTSYAGFDPTAASLHVGSLLPAMALARLQRYGHRPIAIIGGGTGLIGDPSGKTEERKMLTTEQVEENLHGIQEQLRRFLDFDAPENPAAMINNCDWLETIPLIDFLRDVGKHFTVNYMLAKDSVKLRLEQEQGMSFTEFSYMLLQAYDYLVLFDKYKCTLQVGGSDQWGNIVAGIELIRRMRKGKAHGLVFPLVRKASGVKFGKTEKGENIWLDPNLTSPYRFYQFWLNTDDKDVINYLKYFTWLSQEEITEQEEAVAQAPGSREAQKTLAREVTLAVHGETALQRAEQASKVLFGAELSELNAKEIIDIFRDVPSTRMERSVFVGDGASIVDVIAMCDWNESQGGEASGATGERQGLSKGEIRRLIKGGGLYLNNRRLTSDQQRVSLADAIEATVFVLRRGPKQYHLIQISGDDQ